MFIQDAEATFMSAKETKQQECLAGSRWLWEPKSGACVVV